MRVYRLLRDLKIDKIMRWVGRCLELVLSSDVLHVHVALLVLIAAVFVMIRLLSTILVIVNSIDVRVER